MGRGGVAIAFQEVAARPDPRRRQQVMITFSSFPQNLSKSPQNWSSAAPQLKPTPPNRTAPTGVTTRCPTMGRGAPPASRPPPHTPKLGKNTAEKGSGPGGGPQDARGGPNCPQSPPKSPLPPPRARFSFPERTPLSQVLLFSFGPQRNGQKKAKGAGGGTPCGTGFESPRRRCWPGPALLSRHGGCVATYRRCCGTKVLSYKDCIVT